MVIEMVLSNSMGVARVDNNTLLFHDKGAGVFKGISIYPNRIEAVVKNDFFGTHTKIVYLKDITGVNGVKGKRVLLRNRFLTACSYGLSGHSQAQEFVNVLSSVM